MAQVWKSRVAESSTTTGTGAFTLSGAVTGYQTFSAVCSVSDTVDYAIFAVDANGAPTGDWETGVGTYSAASTLTRTTVQESSNAGSAVSFSAGDKIVILSPSATLFGSIVNSTNGTASGLTLNDGYTEEVYAVSGTTPALSPTNGSIQTWTLSGNSTPTAGTWAAGQSLTLMIDDGTAYTVTWTSVAVTWVGGSAPTLATSGYSVIELWKVGTTIYGAYIGDVA